MKIKAKPTNRGASAVISRINSKGEKEFLMVSSKLDAGEHTGKLYPPAGWLEPGETEEEALIRELKEELNFDIKPLRKIADIPGDVPKEFTIHFWECELLGGDLVIDKVEIDYIGWYTLKALESEDIYPATRKMFSIYTGETPKEK